MSTVLLLSERNDHTYATARRVRLRDRIHARCCSVALDNALAEGASPESSTPLALRAQALLKPRVRRRLAKHMQAILRTARGEARRPRHAVPLSRQTVCLAAPELAQLTWRLLDDQPIAVRGIALTQTLLCDGNSPLYGADATVLRTIVIAAIDGLEPFSG
ncbi:MAG: hypothetical protein ACRDLP_02080 [Solirubrobacteraceae bacterium]